MKHVLCFLLLLGVSAAGQDKSAVRRLPETPKLHSTLLALKDGGGDRLSLSHQLVDAIMSQAEREYQPLRTTVKNFADELTSALLGKDSTNAQVLMLERSIDDVLRRSGATFTSASHLRETLATLGVGALKTQVITKRFIAIGEEVRGPDDLSAQ